jgi:hypothetical protein
MTCAAHRPIRGDHQSLAIAPRSDEPGSTSTNVGHWEANYLDRAALTEYIQAGNDREAV